MKVIFKLYKVLFYFCLLFGLFFGTVMAHELTHWVYDWGAENQRIVFNFSWDSPAYYTSDELKFLPVGSKQLFWEEFVAYTVSAIYMTIWMLTVMFEILIKRYEVKQND